MRDTTIRFALCATTEEPCLARAVGMNLERLLPLWHGEKRIFMLQMDEIAVEQRARYCKETDEILGLCVQHTDPSLTKFSIDNLERISQSLGRDADKGGMHIGHEASVIAISALGAKAHHAYPVVVFAGCKAPNPEQQRLALTVVSLFALKHRNVFDALCVTFVKTTFTYRFQSALTVI
ncbi:unnamed protein product [Hapterophycus canaliculatus]